MGKLDGLVALISGAGHGIGRATAERLASEGAAIVIAEINRDFGEKAAEELVAAGHSAQFVETDVAKRDDLQRAVASAVDSFGKLDILVNNAQWTPSGRITDVSDEDWERGLETSVTSVFRACKYAIPHMQRQGGGAIVNVSSIYGLVAGRRRAAYNTTKAAIVNLTRNIALDYAADGIRVNCVCPGGVATWDPREPDPFTRASRWTERRYPEPLNLDQRALQHPVGRHGRPEEVAEAILFLVDPANAFTTGSALVVDGGLTSQALL